MECSQFYPTAGTFLGLPSPVSKCISQALGHSVRRPKNFRKQIGEVRHCSMKISRLHFDRAAAASHTRKTAASEAEPLRRHSCGCIRDPLRSLLASAAQRLAAYRANATLTWIEGWRSSAAQSWVVPPHPQRLSPKTSLDRV